MIDKWILVNRNSGYERTYLEDEFWKLKRYCQTRIRLETSTNFQIEYYQDDELDEIVEVTDYF